MILPIIGQECIVVYRGELHMGNVTSVGVNHEGKYRIGVRGAWGYAIDFKSYDVQLVELRYGDGKVFDQEAARDAFMKKYDTATQMAMLNADSGVPAAKSAPPPPPPPPPARLVHDGVQPRKTIAEHKRTVNVVTARILRRSRS